MSYKRGSFNAGKPGTGKKGYSTLRKAFLDLQKAVQQSADNAVKSVISSQDTYEMTFDETEAIPVTVPSSGTIMLVGTENTDAATLNATLTQLANQSLEAMQNELKRGMKEAGYD